jgi:glycosidase
VTVSDDLSSARKAGYAIEMVGVDDVEIMPIYVPVWNEKTPFDWRSAIMYFAFTDRFYNGNGANDAPLGVQYDWMGGDFAGLKQKVEAGYFDDLGVNALWISSVSMNTQSIVGADGFSMSAYHSYWPLTTGYTEKTASMFAGAYSNSVAITPIEPHFGSLGELKALVKACHDRGIRVLVDFAVNHVNSESPVFIAHPEWFNLPAELCTGNNQQNWNRIPETCWFGDNLPDFNYNIPEVRKFVVDHARWLIRTTDIDGFRLDAVKHMPKQFISDLRLGIDAMMANSGETFYIVGETFDGKDKIQQYIGDTLLHGQFDFPLYNKLRDTIMNGNGKFWDLKDFVIGGDGDGAYGDAIMSTFLGNHDVARAISHIHHDSEDKYRSNNEVTDAWAYRQLKLAWVFLMTSPMIPLIYYGDEFGLEGANDPDNRRMMKFNAQLNPLQKETLQLVQKLGQLRHQHPAMYKGKRQNIDAYERSYMYLMQGEGETVLVGISDSDEPQNYQVSAGTKGWINLLDESETITETTSITLTKDRYIIVWKLKD